RQRQKVGVHNLGDRSGAGHRRTNCDTGDRFLGDRRIAHAALAKLLDQATGHAEDAATRSPDGDLLTNNKDVRIAAHLFTERLVERLRVSQISHRALFSAQSLPALSGAILGGYPPDPAHVEGDGESPGERRLSHCVGGAERSGWGSHTVAIGRTTSHTGTIGWCTPQPRSDGTLREKVLVNAVDGWLGTLACELLGFTNRRHGII